MRESFVFYRSFMEALDELNDRQYANVFRAITKFALDGKEPNLTGIEKAIFTLVKPQLLANQKRYENGCKGGRKETKRQPKDNQNETKAQPNDNDLKVSKKEEIINNNYTCESYEEIMEVFGVSEMLKPTLWEFIKHCHLNGKKVTNDKLEDIIVELDKKVEEAEKIRMVQNAIRGGYYDVKRCS